MGFDLREKKTGTVTGLISVALLVANIILAAIFWRTWNYGIWVLFMILCYVAAVGALVFLLLFAITLFFRRTSASHWIVALILTVIALVLVGSSLAYIWRVPYELFPDAVSIVCIIIAILLVRKDSGPSSSATKA
eukprot:m51a1_g657 hypothetical protein (135) ;mRNA; f:226420-227111